MLADASALLEYANATGSPQPIYQEFAVGIQFACELEISQGPDEPFGSKRKAFGSKKAARSNAAKEAIEWLRANNYMDDNGPPKRKKAKNPTMILNSDEASSSGKAEGEMSYAQQVTGTSTYFHPLLFSTSLQAPTQ